jgi:isopentenyl-diphosphate Delta-isomerase
MDDSLVCVDSDDVALFPLARADCHKGEGVLHRAFSVFLFDTQGRVLLQQRSALKALWPGYWSNSCCSHPRWMETMEHAVERRLFEELGVRTKVEPSHTFVYHARYGDIGSEREYCHVFLGTLESTDLFPDPDEILAVRWVDRHDLDREIAAGTTDFTPWFLQEWDVVREPLQTSC